MLLPDLKDSTGTVRHLVVGAARTATLSRQPDSMGKFNSSSNQQIWQQVGNAMPSGIWSTPAYFNGAVYYGEVGATLKAFSMANAKLVAAPQSQTASQFTYPGTAPGVSANGTSNGILWAHENTNRRPARLRRRQSRP